MKNTEKILRMARKKIVIMSLIMISAIFAIALVSNSLTTVYAKNSDVIDVPNKSQNMMLQDDFDENKVIVVLNQKNSRLDKTVKIEDFGIDLERAGLIRSGNLSTEEQGKNLESESEAVRTGRAVISDLFKVDNMESGRITEKSELFQILSIELPSGGKDRVFQAIEELEKSEIVYSAEPDYNHNAIDLWIPNDTHYATNQWGLTGANGIQAANAWDFTRGNVNINVGLFETGAQQNHPDLNGRFIAPNFTLGATDHGTHVAGIVGAISNNNRGVAGVAQSRMLLLNRASNSFVNSLSHAAEQDVWIINASYSYTIHDAAGNVIGYAPLNTSHAAAIWNYGELGGLIICAAGNGIGGVAQDTDTTPMYPASYSTYTIPRKTFLGFEIQPARPITNVISVGSIDNGGARSSFSNFGSTSVQIFAPGRNILSTFPTTRWGTIVDGYTQIAEGYARTQGTSMAAPHVAGVAALIRSINQDLTAVQVKNAILNNVSYSIDASGNNRLAGLCSSQGMLNAHQALASVALMHTPSGNNATITGIANGINLTGTLVIPESINRRTVSQISSSTFSGQTQLTHITIPSTVTHVGSDAFKNTNNASINLTGRTKAPSTFNSNWNSSANPVYFNSNPCLHNSVTSINLNDTHHNNFCDDCRTIFSKTLHNKYVSNGWEYCYDCSYSKPVAHVHNFTGPYTNMGNLHRQYCACGDYVERPHIGVPNNPGDRYVLCWDCNEWIDTWYYLILIPFRVGVDLDDYDCDDCHHHDHDYEIIMIDQEAYIYLDRKRDYYVDLNKRERNFIV